MFSFNSEGLWIANNKKIAIDDENSLGHWVSLMKRIEKEQG